jgi:hypothetical protein
MRIEPVSALASTGIQASIVANASVVTHNFITRFKTAIVGHIQ